MTAERPIYLDYNATTPVDPRVLAEMEPYFSERFGNPSSAHPYGYEAHAALDRARERVAALLGAQPDEIVFTGGGSEADNLAIVGTAFANLDRRPHIITTSTEHPAVLNTLSYLKTRFGVGYTLVPVDEFGIVSTESVANAIRPETVLLTVMHANNEVGTVQPVAELAEIARRHGILFHVDAAQSAGKMGIDRAAWGIDLLTIAGHKVYAPKGVGALYVRRGVKIDALVHGSSQERGLRAGTENVAGMVALGAAAEVAVEELEAEERRLRSLRDTLHQLLAERIPGLLLNGHPDIRLPNTLNVSLPGAVGQTVLALTPEIAASTGAACHAGTTEPSGVLMAMGISMERALGAIRLSLGRWTTPEEIARAADVLLAGYQRATASASMAQA